jgi:hypothetical protein
MTPKQMLIAELVFIWFVAVFIAWFFMYTWLGVGMAAVASVIRLTVYFLVE